MSRLAALFLTPPKQEEFQLVKFNLLKSINLNLASELEFKQITT